MRGRSVTYVPGIWSVTFVSGRTDAITEKNPHVPSPRISHTLGSLVGVNVTLEDPDATDIAPFDASVNQGTEQMATETAEFVAEELGGSGNVVGVGIGIPVPVIQYQMSVMQEQAEVILDAG